MTKDEFYVPPLPASRNISRRGDVCGLGNGAYSEFHKCQPHHSTSDVHPKA